MPGLHLFWSTKEELPHRRIDASLNNVLHDGRYFHRVLIQNRTFRADITAYPSYPLISDEKFDRLTLLEGKVYGRSEATVTSELDAVAREVFGARHIRLHPLAEWLVGQDGDFVGLLFDRATGGWVLFTDLLGRLPLYQFQSGDFACLSREISLLPALADTVQPDRVAAAQYLVFGYTPGRSTLIKNIKRQAPATITWSESESQPSRRYRWHSIEVTPTDTGETLESIAEELVRLFQKSCVDRYDGHNNNVVALSGGHDSRAVAAAMSGLGLPLTARTFALADTSNRADVETARAVAAVLRLDWQVLELSAPTFGDAATLLQIKAGLIDSSQSYDLQFFKQLRSALGDKCAMFTGDGGDKTLPDLTPSHRPTNDEQLIDYLNDRQGLVPPKMAARLFGLAPTDLLQDLQTTVSAYPASDASLRYAHFLIEERGIKWLFEGEDRNRVEFWCLAPFYSSAFFLKAISIPAALKRYHVLYREFLMRLSVKAASVPDANRGVSIVSGEYENLLRLIALAGKFPRMLQWLKQKARRRNPHQLAPAMLQVIKDQIESSHVLRENVDRSALSELLSMRDSRAPLLWDRLLSATTTWSQVVDGVDVLGQYPNKEL